MTKIRCGPIVRKVAPCACKAARGLREREERGQVLGTSRIDRCWPTDFLRLEGYNHRRGPDLEGRFNGRVITVFGGLTSTCSPEGIY
jgi:hypothetical protein